MPLIQLMHLKKPPSDSEDDVKVPPKSDHWATAHTVVHGTFERALTNTPNDVPASAIAIVKAEGSLCDVNGGFIADMEIYAQLFVPKTDWFLVLINMYWRALRQAAIWNVFLRLLAKDLVKIDALQLPIDITGCSTATHWFTRFLSCFDVLVSQADEAWSGIIPCQGVERLTDINWLATIMVRSGSDLESVLEQILASVEHDPQDRLGNLKPDGNLNPGNAVFAFWLPHGLTNDHDVRIKRLTRSTQRARDIEDAFRQVESPPIGVLIIDFRSAIEPTFIIQDDSQVEDVSDVPGMEDAILIQDQNWKN
ncbi:hypothetical protein N7540_002193 [Penicillium herquei]|nr:hypothetical protein N7540_002193 [Penicillium herquei]